LYKQTITCKAGNFVLRPKAAKQRKHESADENKESTKVLMFPFATQCKARVYNANNEGNTAN